MMTDKCDTFIKRLRGFLFYSKKSAGSAKLFENCRVIHTFFMFRPLRVLFLNDKMEVVREIPLLKPFRIAACFQASHVIEILL
ncbi:MAG: hypothetical protein A2293_10795 [Elusimicrobia bacterium RIFOXYB2_FULL_49_7]|nr:MAG: hypothetical protein A2293_10795 [Elusimicrobia bacterium RIFOXYB2_FULL_49_7]